MNAFSSLYRKLLAGAILLIALAVAPAIMRAQDAIPAAYDRAYSLILDEKWSAAKKEFGEFLKKYPKGSYADAAQYWQCYTRDQLGENSEDVFNCYQDFVAAYPKSKWVKDAKNNPLRDGLLIWETTLTKANSDIREGSF